MKTATMDDLRHRLGMVFAWLEAGEDVVVKAPAPVPADSSDENSVDWSQSAVFKRPLSAKPLLSKSDIDELFEDLRSPY